MTILPRLGPRAGRTTPDDEATDGTASEDSNSAGVLQNEEASA